MKSKNTLRPATYLPAPKQTPTESNIREHLYDYLLILLNSLDGVEQNFRYHPERDALFHSLQVFQLALSSSTDPELWAVALLHDVGKAVDSLTHATIGADHLGGLLSPRIIWLIEHHLDLLTHPKRTRGRLKGTTQLRDLELVRRWDLAGRDPDAEVMSPVDALSILFEHLPVIIKQDR